MTRDEIQKKVQDILADSLGVDEDEVTPQAVLRDDLGAESIDYLDIQFRLEKAFGFLEHDPKTSMMLPRIQRPGSPAPLNSLPLWSAPA